MMDQHLFKALASSFGQAPHLAPGEHTGGCMAVKKFLLAQSKPHCGRTQPPVCLPGAKWDYWLRAVVCAFVCGLMNGCVQRELTVQSNPSGAIVLLNDREMGRTPFTHSFLWYGTYDVVLRKDGYQTMKTSADVNAPFWQWVPLDAVTNFLPLRDEHVIRFDLKPEPPLDVTALIARGQILQQQLQSTGRTVNKEVLQVHPMPRATSKPTTTTAPSSNETTSRPANLPE